MNNNKENKFFKILEKKDCALQSLKEVNYFLYNIKKGLFVGNIINKIKKFK